MRAFLNGTPCMWHGPGVAAWNVPGRWHVPLMFALSILNIGEFHK